MAWKNIANNPYWDYNDNPPNPGPTSGLYPLWLKQTAGIRTNPNGEQVYTDVRMVGHPALGSNETMGELSKTYWDSKSPLYPNPTAYGNLNAENSVVTGVATRALEVRTATGTLQAQPAIVVSSSENEVVGSGILLSLIHI